jgi:cohesin complex subunit SA-1/2
MSELVNFILKCTGCSLQVDEHDIEDVDNVTDKLADLQEEFQAQKITDYPLISKVKGTAFSRPIMVGFIHSLIATTHASGLLYSDESLIENIQVWTGTMSSSGIRPFRHTATVISLAVASALCEAMKDVVENTATTMRQKEGEQKKKSVNKARVAALQAKIKEDQKRKELVEKWLKDIFDTVFVHRYRDVDPKIRMDCATALGNWIYTCPDIFFEGQYLRYLGWVLSDTSATTRVEAVKQLLRLYKDKDNVGRLRAFTERFRPRMVEMATRDTEPSVRASVVELLDLIRDFGLLEPDDIDSIGQLIFDSEPRVRKAVSSFFAAIIIDVYEQAIEELGGEENLDDILGDVSDEDYDKPRLAWLKLKCLAEVLRSYDTNGGSESPQTTLPDTDYLGTTTLESRYALAAEAICRAVPEVKTWEVLAGYLLHDHSSTLAGKNADDAQAAFRERCQLDEAEEKLLIEILDAAVNFRLTEAVDLEADKKSKGIKARKEEAKEIQESTALHLAKTIPPLLRKFGANPYTASTVLRLEQLLNLDVFQELRQDSTEFAALLDDISKQFLTHANHSVLANAKMALLRARANEELEETTETKIMEIWDDTIGTLRQLSKARKPSIPALTNTLLRISNLASISNPVELFESEQPQGTKGTPKSGRTKVYDILIDLIRLHASDDTSSSLVSAAIKCLWFYYMWIVKALTEKLQKDEETVDAPDLTEFSTSVQKVIESGSKLDNVRLEAIGDLLTLYTSFATLGKEYINVIPSETQDQILISFVAAEKAHASKAKRLLEDPAEDDPPEDPDSEPEDSSDEDEAEDDDARARKRQLRRQEQLLAEKRLCDLTGKIVLAIIAQVIDRKGRIRQRIIRNKTRLGPNFKEVLNYLEEPKPKRQRVKAGDAKKQTLQVGGPHKSEAIVNDVDDEDEEEDARGAMEEDGEEDLRKQGLQEDIVDDSGGEASEKGDAVAAQDDEDDILGD